MRFFLKHGKIYVWDLKATLESANFTVGSSNGKPGKVEEMASPFILPYQFFKHFVVKILDILGNLHACYSQLHRINRILYEPRMLERYFQYHIFKY